MRCKLVFFVYGAESEMAEDVLMNSLFDNPEFFCRPSNYDSLCSYLEKRDFNSGCVGVFADLSFEMRDEDNINQSEHLESTDKRIHGNVGSKQLKVSQDVMNVSYPTKIFVSTNAGIKDYQGQ